MKNLRYFRRKAGYTQTRLAKAIGVDQSAISYWESGKIEPRMKNVLKLSRLLGCSMEELMEEGSELDVSRNEKV